MELLNVQRLFPSAQNILFYESFVLVCPGCCNKILQTEWLINNRNLFFTVLDAGKSKIQELVDLVSGEERRLSGSMLSCSQGAMALLKPCIMKGSRVFPDLFSVQFSLSVRSDSLRPPDCSTPGFPVHHQLPEITQTHDHRAGDAIQPSHPLSSPSPPAFNLSQHLGLVQ